MVRVAAGIANPCVNETLAATEVLPVQVLDAPEAAGGDGGLLRALGNRHRHASSAASTGNSELRDPAGYGAEQARKEIGKDKGTGHDSYRNYQCGLYGGGCGVCWSLASSRV